MIRTDKQKPTPIPDFCGKKVTSSDLELVRDVVKSCGFTPTELARTVCELLGWKRANRKLKDQECVYWLEELDHLGLIQLPIPKQSRISVSRSRVDLTKRSESQETLTGSVKSISPVRLRRLEGSTELALWKELVARHHYLGFRVPFGANLRYFIEITTATGPQVAGCLQFSSPAWRVEARDQWIGWKDQSRKKHLQKIVSNSRFLILPWIQIKGLASHVLSLVTRCLQDDWYECYRIRPVLLETFVEQERFAGTCYKAANWVCLGETRGRGRMDRNNEHTEPIRSVWIYPLDKHCREILCGTAPK